MPRLERAPVDPPASITSEVALVYGWRRKAGGKPSSRDATKLIGPSSPPHRPAQDNVTTARTSNLPAKQQSVARPPGRSNSHEPVLQSRSTSQSTGQQCDQHDDESHTANARRPIAVRMEFPARQASHDQEDCHDEKNQSQSHSISFLRNSLRLPLSQAPDCAGAPQQPVTLGIAESAIREIPHGSRRCAGVRSVGGR